MPRPRTLDAHPREFFAFTEELLTVPVRTVGCGDGRVGSAKALALRAGMYHFWAKLRTVVEEAEFRPDKLEVLAQALIASGKLPDTADATLLRALFRVAANTALSIHCEEGQPARWFLRFIPKSSTSLAALLGENLTAPTEPTADGGAGLLAELERETR